MLGSLIRFCGFNGLKAPPAPVKKVRTAASPPSPPFVKVDESFEELEARSRARAEAQRPFDEAKEFATAVRRIAKSHGLAPDRGRPVGGVDFLTAGPAVSEYVRACAIAKHGFRVLGDSEIDNQTRVLAYAADLKERALTDIDAWTEAMAVLRTQTARAVAVGDRVPEPLHVPPAVEKEITRRALEKARALARGGSRGTRSSSSSGSGGGPEATPEKTGVEETQAPTAK